MSELKHVSGRVICGVDLEAKNWHTFDSGLKIRRERKYNEFNRRITEPVNAEVVSGENIPQGVEILVHQNAFCETNKINNYLSLSGNETASSVKYFSIEEEQCFLWYDKENKKWNPLKGFATGLRVFEPYNGFLVGIEPVQVKNILYITSGEYEGCVVHTLRSCDYCIIFQNINGKEGQVIRLRHYEGLNHDREEIICIDYNITDKVNEGKLLIGLSISDCKTLNIYQDA